MANLTVFAPTNQAFEAALAALRIPLNTLLAETDVLQQVLEYHVVNGSYMAADLMNGEVLHTLLPGGTLTVEIMNGNVSIVPTGGMPATVVQPNIAADNGVIHIIDAVLLPAPAAPSME